MSMPQPRPVSQAAEPLRAAHAPHAPQVNRPSEDDSASRRGNARSPTVRSTMDEMSLPPPSWGAAASSAPPERAPEGPIEALCKICQSPFTRSADDARDSICSSCRSLSAQVQQMAPSEVQILPAVFDEPPKSGFAERTSSSAPRPRPVLRKRAGLRTGPVVALVGLALGLAGLGVVAWQGRDMDRSKEVVGETYSEPSIVGEAPASFHTVQRATLRFTILREQAQAFGAVTKALDVHQTVEQVSECAVALARDDVVAFDVLSEGRVVEQTGTVLGTTDGREAGLYPWTGPHARFRVAAGPTRPLVQLDGEAVLVGRDVPPLFHLGELRPTGASFQPGDRWKATVRLPLLVTRAGQTLTWDYPLDVIYAGVAVKYGVRCAAFRLVAKTMTQVPAPLSDDFNRTSGTVGGAVWIELSTGLTTAADVESDLRIWSDTGRVEDDLHVRGRLTIDRP